MGSYDEPPGLTGLSHFVEHMLFKGTEQFPKGQIDRVVSSAAGQCNAETGEDSTITGLRSRRIVGSWR